MVNIGKHLNHSITAVITSMEEPLGRAVGNALEIIESIEFLKGNIKTGDIADLTYSFAAIALVQLGKYKNEDDAKKYLQEVVESGKALEKFRELIVEQAGNPSVIDDYKNFEQAKYKVECKAKQSGYLHRIDAYKIAYGCKLLGAGRETKADSIDYSVGVFLNKKSGEYVNSDDVLYTIYSNDENKTKVAQEYCNEAFLIKEGEPVQNPMIYKIIR